MEHKTCSRCSEVKPIDAFPKQRTYCKRCWNRQCRPTQKRWAEKNREKMNGSQKKWREKNIEKVKEYKSAYLKENKAKINEYGKSYRSKNLDIRKAHDAVKYALRVGKIKQERCLCCGADAQAHHPSYAKDMRLSVVWLCPKHHSEVHS